LSAATSVTPRPRSIAQADFLDHEIAGEAVCRLDDDRADAIVGDSGEQVSKAGPHVNRIGTAHRGVVDRGG
jgi:hypothetical protein